MGQRRKRLVACVLLFLTVALYGQAGQEPEDLFVSAMVSIMPQQPRAGERIQLKIVFPVRFSADGVFNAGQAFPAGLDIINGPAVRVLSDRSEGDRVEYAYTIMAQEPGIYHLDSFRLKMSDLFSKSLPVDLHILPSSAISAETPKIEAAWRRVPEDVYQGEAFSLILEARNLTELASIETAALPPVSGVIIESSHGYGGIIEDVVDNGKYYAIPIGAWVLTPQQSGKLVIPRIRARIGNRTYQTEPLSIEVKPTPQIAREFGAVGNFRLTGSLSETEILEGESAVFKVRLEGEGSFHVLQIPDPDFAGLELLDKQESERLVPALGGYSGFREIVYRLKAKTAGSYNVPLPALVWWNPKMNRVERSKTALFSIKALSLTSNENFLPFMDLAAIEKTRDFVPFLRLLWLIPALLALFLHLFVKDKKPVKEPLRFFAVLPLAFIGLLPQEELPQTFAKAHAAIEQDDWQQAFDLYKGAAGLRPYEAAKHYNTAACAMRLGLTGETAYNLKQALTLDPFNSFYAKQMQNYLALRRLTAVSSSSKAMHAHVLPILALLWFFAAALALALRRNVWAKKILLSSCLVLGTAAAARGLYEIYPRRQEAIALFDGEFYRIPDDASGSSAGVKAGSAFAVKSKYRDFYLLYGKEGTEGWMHSQNLAMLKNAYGR